MPASNEIKTILGGLQNQAPVYFSTVKLLMLQVAAGFTGLSFTVGASVATAFANGNPEEHIADWATLKPKLNGALSVSIFLKNAGADTTALNALIENIPNGPGEVFCDQLKPIFYEIAGLLLGLGQ